MLVCFAIKNLGDEIDAVSHFKNHGIKIFILYLKSNTEKSIVEYEDGYIIYGSGYNSVLKFLRTLNLEDYVLFAELNWTIKELTLDLTQDEYFVDIYTSDFSLFRYKRLIKINSRVTYKTNYTTSTNSETFSVCIFAANQISSTEELDILMKLYNKTKNNQLLFYIGDIHTRLGNTLESWDYYRTIIEEESSVLNCEKFLAYCRLSIFPKALEIEDNFYIRLKLNTLESLKCAFEMVKGNAFLAKKLSPNIIQKIDKNEQLLYHLEQLNLILNNHEISNIVEKYKSRSGIFVMIFSNGEKHKNLYSKYLKKLGINHVFFEYIHNGTPKKYKNTVQFLIEQKMPIEVLNYAKNLNFKNLIFTSSTFLPNFSQLKEILENEQIDYAGICEKSFSNARINFPGNFFDYKLLIISKKFLINDLILKTSPPKVSNLDVFIGIIFLRNSEEYNRRKLDLELESIPSLEFLVDKFNNYDNIELEKIFFNSESNFSCLYDIILKSESVFEVGSSNETWSILMALSGGKYYNAYNNEILIEFCRQNEIVYGEIENFDIAILNERYDIDFSRCNKMIVSKFELNIENWKMHRYQNYYIYEKNLFPKLIETFVIMPGNSQELILRKMENTNEMVDFFIVCELVENGQIFSNSCFDKFRHKTAYLSVSENLETYNNEQIIAFLTNCFDDVIEILKLNPEDVILYSDIRCIFDVLKLKNIIFSGKVDAINLELKASISGKQIEEKFNTVICNHDLYSEIKISSHMKNVVCFSNIECGEYSC